VSLREIFHSAQIIDHYQDRAWPEAIARMDRYWLEDNDEQMHVWRLIANAFSIIRQARRFDGENLH
jgi:hypothetical protein